MESNDLKLQSLHGLVEEDTKVQNELVELRTTVAEDRANVAFMKVLRYEVSAVKEAVAELLPAIEKLLIFM